MFDSATLKKCCLNKEPVLEERFLQKNFPFLHTPGFTRMKIKMKKSACFN